MIMIVKITNTIRTLTQIAKMLVTMEKRSVMMRMMWTMDATLSKESANGNVLLIFLTMIRMIIFTIPIRILHVRMPVTTATGDVNSLEFSFD